MEVVVKNNMKRLVGLDGVKGSFSLLPGANKISLEDAKKVMSHPVVKAQIENGELEFLMPEGDAPETGATPVEALVKLKAKEALETVANTADAVILQEWFEKESRVTVKDAISKQLEALSAPADHREE